MIFWGTFDIYAVNGIINPNAKSEVLQNFKSFQYWHIVSTTSEKSLDDHMESQV